AVRARDRHLALQGTCRRGRGLPFQLSHPRQRRQLEGPRSSDHGQQARRSAQARDRARDRGRCRLCRGEPCTGPRRIADGCDLMSIAAVKPATQGTRVLSYASALLETMDGALADHPNTFIMGQGVDDFKGIFGSTTRLAEKYGAPRVFDVPLMEEGMTGVAIGASLVGDYPITTHIRADFSFLAMNQIINLAAKYRYMFGGLMSCPMLIRIVVGRSWGQGAQHSQSPQATFAHYPGLTVVMPSSSQAILDMYPAIINRHPGPVISIEHRLLYNLDFTVSPSEHRVPL